MHWNGIPRNRVRVPVEMHVFHISSIVFSTAKTDLGLRSRTFSLKINKLPTFSEINQGGGAMFKDGVYTVR